MSKARKYNPRGPQHDNAQVDSQTLTSIFEHSRNEIHSQKLTINLLIYIFARISGDHVMYNMPEAAKPPFFQRYLVQRVSYTRNLPVMSRGIT